jgi:hypothetical protein
VPRKLSPLIYGATQRHTDCDYFSLIWDALSKSRLQAELTQRPQKFRLLRVIRHGIALQPALRGECRIENANLVRLPGGG